MAARFDISALGNDPSRVACVVSGADLFSILTRRVSVPPSCAALVWGESGQPRVAPAGADIEASEARRVLFVRTAPFAIEYDIDGLTSKDEFAVAARLRLDVGVEPRQSELTAFAQNVLGSGTEVTTERLRQHCAPTIRAALDEFARSRPAEALLIPATGEAFDALLAERFKELAFTSGLTLGPRPTVEFRSRDYAAAQSEAEADEDQRRRLARAGELQEAVNEARHRHLGHLADLLDEAQRLVAARPGLTLADVIKTFDAGHRSELYKGMMALHRPNARTEAIIVVAGDGLLRLDPAALSRPAERWELSSPAGPLRSVRLAETKAVRVLLVGARRGVHVVGLDGAVTRTCLLRGQFDLKGGFNAAVLLGGCLYGTHSEVGLVRWRVDADAAADATPAHEPCLADLTAGAKTVRDVQLDDVGRLWFSADQFVVGWSPDESGPPIVLHVSAVVSALRVAGGRIHAGLDDGRIVCWELADPAATETLRGPTGGAVRSLDWVCGGGVPRLLIAEGRSQIDLQVVGDSYVGAYCCEQRLRWGFAAEDWLVGVNDRRDQLLLWRWNEPERPAERISIGQLCGHSIQDVILVPAAEKTWHA